MCVCVCQLQSVASLKVTIQQSSESREFGQTDRTADRQTGGLHCHVCNLTCRSVQVRHSEHTHLRLTLYSQSRLEDRK